MTYQSRSETPGESKEGSYQYDLLTPRELKKKFSTTLKDLPLVVMLEPDSTPFDWTSPDDQEESSSFLFLLSPHFPFIFQIRAHTSRDPSLLALVGRLTGLRRVRIVESLQRKENVLGRPGQPFGKLLSLGNIGLELLQPVTQQRLGRLTQKLSFYKNGKQTEAVLCLASIHGSQTLSNQFPEVVLPEGCCTLELNIKWKGFAKILQSLVWFSEPYIKPNKVYYCSIKLNTNFRCNLFFSLFKKHQTSISVHQDQRRERLRLIQLELVVTDKAKSASGREYQMSFYKSLSQPKICNNLQNYQLRTYVPLEKLFPIPLRREIFSQKEITGEVFSYSNLKPKDQPTEFSILLPKFEVDLSKAVRTLPLLAFNKQIYFFIQSKSMSISSNTQKQLFSSQNRNTQELQKHSIEANQSIKSDVLKKAEDHSPALSSPKPKLKASEGLLKLSRPFFGEDKGLPPDFLNPPRRSSQNSEDQSHPLLNYIQHRELCSVLQDSVACLDPSLDKPILQRLLQLLSPRLFQVATAKYGNFFLQMVFEKLDSDLLAELVVGPVSRDFARLCKDPRAIFPMQKLVQLCLSSQECQNHILSMVEKDFPTLWGNHYAGFVLKKIILQFDSEAADRIFFLLREKFFNVICDKYGICLIKFLITRTEQNTMERGGSTLSEEDEKISRSRMESIAEQFKINLKKGRNNSHYNYGLTHILEVIDKKKWTLNSIENLIADYLSEPDRLALGSKAVSDTLQKMGKYHNKSFCASFVWPALIHFQDLSSKKQRSKGLEKSPTIYEMEPRLKQDISKYRELLQAGNYLSDSIEDVPSGTGISSIQREKPPPILDKGFSKGSKKKAPSRLETSKNLHQSEEL